MRTCLIVEDETISLNILQEEFQTAGYCVTTIEDGQEAHDLCVKNTYDLVLLDMHLPRKSGLDILRAVRARSKATIVIIITAIARVETAVEAMKLGADDYITKPYDIGELLKKTEQLFASRAKLLSIDRAGLRDSAESAIMGQDPLLLQVRDVIRKVRDIGTTVLITGESGTGKGVVAKEIHATGSRAAAPFVHVNCAAIQPNLIESELFGHEKGAFTSASSTKKGKLELAGEGTVFLDEIGIMPINLQSKLLTVLQEHFYERVGGTQRFPLRARIIAATNENLEECVKNGTFRTDLYYRLNVIRIEVPPLRYRRKDLPLLAEEFIRRFQGAMDKEIRFVSDDFWNALLHYGWPGNIRELENTIEAAVALCDDNMLTAKSLPIRIAKPDFHSINPEPAEPDGAYKAVLGQQEAAIIAAALEKFNGHRERTAQYLGISKRTLQYKLKSLQMLNRE